MTTVPTDKLKAAESALTQIERQFGKGSIMRLGAKEFAAISSISSGSIGVDAALGVGGVPRGRIIEIFGPESSGKTTLSLHVIAEAQRVGGLAAFIDAEHALDAELALDLGQRQLRCFQFVCGNRGHEPAPSSLSTRNFPIVVFHWRGEGWMERTGMRVVD